MVLVSAWWLQLAETRLLWGHALFMGRLVFNNDTLEWFQNLFSLQEFQQP